MFVYLSSLVLNLPPLVYVVIGLATVWYLMTRSRVPDNIPPVPVRPYPILGHFPMLKAGTIKMLHEWRQLKGDIFSIYFGSNLAVVINSFDIMKEAFVHNAEFFSDRQTSFYKRKMGFSGIIGNHGASWKEQRSVSMSILRNFGMGKNWLAEKITEEVEVYLETLSKFKGDPLDVSLLTNATVANVIATLIVGKRFDMDDQTVTEVIKLINNQMHLTASVGLKIMATFPWLEHLPGDLFSVKKYMSNMEGIDQFLSLKFLQEKDDTGGDNFVTSYLKTQKAKIESGTFTYLDDKNLVRVLSDLFLAGSETTSTTLLWAMLFAIHNPEAQDKVYQEIADVCGTSRLPSLQDRTKMPYVNAFIMETQRRGSITPLSVPHFCNADTTVAGYTIPKGTVVIPNLDEVLKDTKTWGDPLVFRSERFLDKDNNVVVPEQFIPFSIGRRYCMGESLAKTELFLFITGIFQRFHVKPDDPNNLPPLESVFGVTAAPKAFRVRLIERQ